MLVMSILGVITRSKIRRYRKRWNNLVVDLRYVVHLIKNIPVRTSPSITFILRVNFAHFLASNMTSFRKNSKGGEKEVEVNSARVILSDTLILYLFI